MSDALPVHNQSGPLNGPFYSLPSQTPRDTIFNYVAVIALSVAYANGFIQVSINSVWGQIELTPTRVFTALILAFVLLVIGSWLAAPFYFVGMYIEPNQDKLRKVAYLLITGILISSGNSLTEIGIGSWMELAGASIALKAIIGSTVGPAIQLLSVIYAIYGNPKHPIDQFARAVKWDADRRVLVAQLGEGQGVVEYGPAGWAPRPAK